jgi:homoserine dehydrogenase
MATAKTRRSVGIGLLGSGVVGEAIQDIIFRDLKGMVGDDLQLEIRKIYTRRPKSKKWFAKRRSLFTTNPLEVIDDPRVDIVVEVLGYQRLAELAAFKNYIIRALKKGKSVVTSDKAVLARYGGEILKVARQNGRQLRFEACVGGGIPIIRTLSESFAVEDPEAVFGIVNGTCNYILSEMEKSAKPYVEALAEAQRRGYAETNPTADVSGRDAEAKLLLLARVAFGAEVAPGTIWRKGIEDLHAVDFRYAGGTGRSTIKQLAVAKRIDGRLELFVSPVLIPQNHFLAAIDGATNAICYKGRKSGGSVERDCDYVLVGPGAGGGPTAVAVLGDVCELARGEGRRSTGVPSMIGARALKIQPQSEIRESFYVRFIVKDRAGIVGDIGQTFGRLGVNISEIWQLKHSDEECESLVRSYHLKAKAADILPFVMTLERASVGKLRSALDSIRKRDYIVNDPVWFPVWGSS